MKAPTAEHIPTTRRAARFSCPPHIITRGCRSAESSPAQPRARRGDWLHVTVRRREKGEMEPAEQPGGGGGRGEKRSAGSSEEEAEEEKARRRHRPGLGLQSDMRRHGTSVLHSTVRFSPDPLPARQYDKHTGEPISFYLSGLEELLAWKPTSDDAFNVATMPVAERQPPFDSPKPRTLVCHDMKGGYLQDRFIQGSPTPDPYVFYHWRYIDVFVYFSHHMVTIPPVGWTNAAHRNGVLMLGTFIMEWTDGGKACESFLAGEEAAYRAVAEQLTELARFYRFDGWLVNIENPLSEAAARNLPSFLKCLRAKVHAAVPGGQVLWYDSVLQNGKLEWQNELNEKNRVYFDACDGFFSNYNWTDEHLERTGWTAGERRHDVYVGVDVFARGVVVGGGFDTDKSLRLIRKHGLSAAIFAPGWVYEHLGPTHFLSNEDKFWGLLAELLPAHGISSLPFSTCFSLGVGTGRFVQGRSESPGPWYNLSAQEIQPLFTNKQLPGGGWLRTRCSLQDAWRGSSCLLLEGTIPPGAENVRVRLFSFRVPAAPKLLLSLVYKFEGPEPPVTVALELTMGDSQSCRVGDISTLPESEVRHQPKPLAAPPHGLAHVLKRCGQKNPHGWQIRCYELPLQKCSLHELSVSVSRRQPGHSEIPFSCRLGEIWVLDATRLLSPESSLLSVDGLHVSWRRESTAPLSLSLTLRWTYPPTQARCFRIHCREGNCAGGAEPPTRLLGEAYAPLYRVTDLPVPNARPGASCRIEFLVEPVSDDGLPAELARWGRLVLVYTGPKDSSTGASA